MAELLNGAVLHVRFEGQSRDVALAELDVGLHSSDAAIKQCWHATSAWPRPSCAMTSLTGTRPAT